MKKFAIIILTLASLVSFAAEDNTCLSASGQHKQYFLKCDVGAAVIKTYTEMFVAVADSAVISGAEDTADILYNMRLDFFMDDLAMRCDMAKESVSCEAFVTISDALKENNIPDDSGLVMNGFRS